MDEPGIAARRAGIAVVWGAVAVAAAAVVIAVPDADVFALLAVTLCLGVVASFVAQLALAEQAGFVARLSTGVTGAFAIVAVGALAAALRLAA